MRMKNVVLFVSLVVAISLFRDAESKRFTLEEVRETLEPVKKICIERVGTDPKMIEDANKGKFVPDRKLQCYYKCLLVMTKSMSKDDQIQEEMFVKIVELMLDEKLVDPVMQAVIHCGPVAMQTMEGCQLAYEITKCLYEYDPTLMFFP
ncbi:PREDICTED: uncharacterized protein LOC106748311 [Dinoponera quadriceps]|uniref:Uncharacterized protein LOC106748311 n=1 Tax=Dinoponera quadriceps TaxID=609295 RepID=A0A6P3XUI6_DINQU|nr:PREDICTED: uncharacterized protein LOC106748311 [Dinoponera quadriceps]